MIRDRARALAPLRSFDSDAFRASGDVPQDLCNLILAFALVSNDCRDLALWSDDLLSVRPDGMRLNRYQGELGGQTFHCLRLICGVIHELGELIQEHSRVLNHSLFVRVLDRLPDRERQMWERVRDLAFGKKSAKPEDDLFKELRNMTAFHYDSSELAQAYDLRFPQGSENRQEQPLLSRGDRVSSVRFYFADAAVTEVLEQQINQRRISSFGKSLSETLRDITVALALIIQGFIEMRSEVSDFSEELAPVGASDDLSP